MYRANFRRYWREHLVHLAVGVFAGLLATHGNPWAALLIMGTVWVRQGLEWGNRSFIPRMTRAMRGQDAKDWLSYDTPGIDLSFHLAGVIVGVGAGLLVL